MTKYFYQLPEEMSDKLKVILSCRKYMDASYTMTAINYCRLYKKHNYLDLSKKNAFDRIATYCGYYEV